MIILGRLKKFKAVIGDWGVGLSLGWHRLFYSLAVAVAVFFGAVILDALIPDTLINLYGVGAKALVAMGSGVLVYIFTWAADQSYGEKL